MLCGVTLSVIAVEGTNEKGAKRETENGLEDVRIDCQYASQMRESRLRRFSIFAGLMLMAAQFPSKERHEI